MVVFASELYPQESCTNAQAIEYIPGRKGLLTVDRHVLKLWTVKDTRPYLQLVTQVDFGSTIHQLNTFQHDSKTMVVLLFQNQLNVIEFHDDLSHTKTIVPFDTINGGFLEPMESGPILLKYTDSQKVYAVILRYSGFITLVDLSATLHPNTKISRPKRKAKPESKRSTTYNIGELTIILMTVLSSSPPQLAILYRDVEFYYSLRLYELLMDSNTLKLNKQMETFQGAPTHLYSAVDGIVVVGDTKVWYFPSFPKTVSLSDSAGDSNFPVTLNKLHNVITLNTSSLSSKYLGCKINCSVSIDLKRQLLITDKGDTFLLYLELNVSSSISTVAEFKIVALLKCTIASELTFLQENLFFAASKVSRSVLFRVLQKSPFIDILQTLSNTLPILSLAPISDGYSHNVVVGRGGFFSGEVHILSPNNTLAKHITSAKISVDTSSLEIMKNGKDYVIKTLGVDGSRTTLLVETLKQIMSLDNLIGDEITKPSSGVWQLNRNECLSATSLTPIRLTYSNPKKTEVSLPNFDQLSDLIWIKDSNLVAYASLWNGYLTQVMFKEGKGEPLWEVSLPFKGCSYLTQKGLGPDTYLIIALCGDGSLYQALFYDHEFVISTFRRPFQGGYSFRIFLESADIGGKLFIFDAHNIYELSSLKGSCFLDPRKVLSCEGAILDCKKPPSTNTFIVLFSNGIISRFDLFDTPSFASHFSKRLVKCVVKVSDKYLAVLELEEKPNTSTGHIEYFSHIVLFEQRTMKLLDRYSAEAQDSYVDLCVMTSEYLDQSPLLIAANSGGLCQKMLPIFHIENERLVGPEYYGMNGCFPKKASVVKMACKENRLLLVGSSIIDVALTLMINDGKAWNGGAKDGSKFMVFGVDVAINDGMTALADINRGIFVSFGANSSYEMLHLVSSPSFVTCIALLQSRSILVYGDSAGNVAAVAFEADVCSTNTSQSSSQKNEEIFLLNVGEQINTLCIILENPFRVLVGTVSGRIFRIQDIYMDKSHIHTLKSRLSSSLSKFGSWKALGSHSEDDTELNVVDGSLLLGIENLNLSPYERLEVSLSCYEFYGSF